MKTKYLAAKKSSTDIEFMWIDKYKPMCKEEVLGNNELIKKLKNWLEPKRRKKSNKSKFFPFATIFSSISFTYIVCNFYHAKYLLIIFKVKNIMMTTILSLIPTMILIEYNTM